MNGLTTMGNELLVSQLLTAAVQGSKILSQVLVASYMLRLAKRRGSDVKAAFEAFTQGMAHQWHDGSFWREAGFLLLRHILVSSVYLFPKHSGFVYRQIWLINVLWPILSAIFTPHFKLAYRSLSAHHLAALLSNVLGRATLISLSRIPGPLETEWMLPVLSIPFMRAIRFFYERK